jgi:hypothetical protein
MPVRNVGKWMCMLVIAWTGGSAVASCGGSGNGSVFVDAGTGSDGSSSGATDGSTGSDGPHLVGDDAGDSGGGCVVQTCAQLSYNCGKAVSCGQVIDCTGSGPGPGGCPAGEGCGVGGQANVCGGTVSTDGGPINCTPTDCATLGYNCGFASDGCGNALNCNPNDAATGCTPPQYCGGGGFNQCGGNNGLGTDGGVPCVPTTCAALGYNCGYGNDGCGNLLNCNPPSGGCNPPQYCGGGGFNQCGGNNGLGADGAPNCTPTTCTKLGFNCGPAGDGCGNLIPSCGSCSGSNTCGGGGTPGVCGNSACTGLCKQQPVCSGGVVTTITGTVFAGTPPIFGTPDPVPNVIVYVPNSAVLPFAPGVTCSQCGAEVTGSPLVETQTAFDGTFTLKNVPAGSSIPIVIQLGRWRRSFTVNIPACATTAIPSGTFVMPHNQSEGDIPLTAFSTGSVDTLECVLFKMGVDQAEFTTNAGGGRVHMYEGNGASMGAGTPAETTLMGNGGTFANYDQILFPCWGVDPTTNGSSNAKSAAEQANLLTYANEGGHFFATHYSYAWLYKNSPLSLTAQWNVNHNSFNSGTAQVQVPPTNPEGTVFTNWLHLVGALPAPPNLTIQNPRHDVNKVLLNSVDWMSGADPNDATAMLYHYTFNTPVNGANQCGHAIFSDFHVANASVGSTTVFPAECLTNETTGNACSVAKPCPLTPQEKVLEFMIWDLASCVPGPPTPPTCTPISCQDQNIGCGPAGDGCGNEIQCGACTPPQTCGGGGTPGQCGAPDSGSCAPKTCQDQNINCGPAGDGCGNEIPNCGNCTPPLTCGGGGTPGQCGFPEAGTCNPETCSDQNIFCGPAGDGCGNQIQCGTCTPPLTCGGGGVSGQCGAPDAGTCAPKSCADQGIQCGTASDGCGNVLTCPACPTGQTCNTTTGQCQQNSQ